MAEELVLLCVCSVVFFFFFKQKTAYEMRISDWSSDVCSSDLERAQKKKDKEFNRDILYRHAVGPKVLALGPYSISLFVRGQPLEARLRVAVQTTTELARTQLEAQEMAVNGIVYPLAVRLFEQGRSEEHTSELQSLMRSSYAALCLKKKNKQ